MGRIVAASAAWLLLFSAVFTSCSPLNEPEIHQISARLVQDLDVQTRRQSSHLELHVHIASQKGDHDILSVQLAGPKESFLVWEIDADQLLASYEDGELWIGSNSLQPPYSKRFPSGTYTVKVTNANGAYDEMNLIITDPFRRAEVPGDLFAHYDEQSGMITASSGQLILRGFDANGNPAGFASVTAGRTLESQLDAVENQMGSPLVNFELELRDPLLGQVFRSGVYSY
jgi:hypothetical protein